MGRSFLILIIPLSLFDFISEAQVRGSDVQLITSVSATGDTLPDNQLLFNGRVWQSMYSNVVGDEFLISKDWLTGDVSINEMTFPDVQLRYDIFNDQLLAKYNNAIFVQLNKEFIREFTLTRENRKYTFQNFSGGKDNPVNGFGQVLYKGDIYLIIKTVKQILPLAVDNKYDEFYQLQTIYVLKGDKFYKVTGRKDLISILADRKQQIQTFIRENKIRIRRKEAESYIPVLKFYDTLKDGV